VILFFNPKTKKNNTVVCEWNKHLDRYFIIKDIQNHQHIPFYSNQRIASSIKKIAKENVKK
jgi:hypothetical protein